MSLFPAGRTPINVGPADVGRRVRIEAQEGLLRGRTEVEGVLYRWSGGHKKGILRVRTRSGEEFGVRSADVRTARVQPPEVSAYDMQRLAQQGWPPLHTDMMGEWELRCSNGATDRANSVRVVGPPGRNMKSMTSMISDWYAERDVRPLLQVPQPCGSSDELTAAGWRQNRAGRLMTSSVARLMSETAGAAERTDLDIEVRDSPNPEWLSLFAIRNSQTAAELDHVMEAVAPAAFVFCRDSEGELLGIGRATLQDTWCGATTLDTVPQSRRRGIATTVIASMAQWAGKMGARDWYLQVFNDNAAGRALWERFGFTTHHRYDYWSLQPEEQNPAE